MDDCKNTEDPQFNSLEAFRGNGPCLNPLFTFQGQILVSLLYCPVFVFSQRRSRIRIFLYLYIFIFSKKPRDFSQDFFILYYDINTKTKYQKMPNRPYITMIVDVCNKAKTIISTIMLTEIKTFAHLPSYQITNFCHFLMTLRENYFNHIFVDGYQGLRRRKCPFSFLPFFINNLLCVFLHVK